MCFLRYNKLFYNILAILTIKNNVSILSKGRYNTYVFCGGEKGIRTPDTVVTVYMISNHAPSASSDISPNTFELYQIT